MQKIFAAEKNHEITKHIFLKLYENGFIKEGVLKQPFCEHCNIVLADRFVIGTCPYCGYEKARGDQCDNCGKLLNPNELIDPKSAIDGTTPEFRETKHLFIDLKKLLSFIGHNGRFDFFSRRKLQFNRIWAIYWSHINYDCNYSCVFFGKAQVLCKNYKIFFSDFAW